MNVIIFRDTSKQHTQKKQCKNRNPWESLRCLLHQRLIRERIFVSNSGEIYQTHLIHDPRNSTKNTQCVFWFSFFLQNGNVQQPFSISFWCVFVFCFQPNCIVSYILILSTLERQFDQKIFSIIYTMTPSMYIEIYVYTSVFHCHICGINQTFWRKCD